MTDLNKIISLFIGLFIIIFILALVLGRVSFGGHKVDLSGSLGEIFQGKESDNVETSADSEEKNNEETVDTTVESNGDAVVVVTKPTATPTVKPATNLTTQTYGEKGGQPVTEIPRTGAGSVAPIIVSTMAAGLYLRKRV